MERWLLLDRRALLYWPVLVAVGLSLFFGSIFFWLRGEGMYDEESRRRMSASYILGICAGAAMTAYGIWLGKQLF
ncbi:hypothetical protein IT575_08135 [bacterium]|nr:hypothetical protein [bacterium]